MTTKRRIFVHVALVGAACLGGCGDGRLEVLEPLPATGGSAASGAAGETPGGTSRREIRRPAWFAATAGMKTKGGT